AAAAVYFGAIARGSDAAQVRAATFACLVLGNLSLIVASRSVGSSIIELIRIPNAAQWSVLAGAVLALAAAVYAPALRGVFHFAVPGAETMASSVFAAVAAVAWFEAIKRLYRKSAARVKR
ncbi:MAG TPA: cation transporting ATPase C-terminal domain-containing protein, partial [Noviherbaspirillum sp.]|nr:cation transporting ATPase C-terminal domain-containing protein [Noviherbaspirillum sp.]